MAGIETAGPGEVTFLANRRYAPNLKTTRASAVFVEDGVDVQREPGKPALAKLRTANPYLAFAKAIELFYEAPKYAQGVHVTAVVAKSARIGAGAHVGPYCFVDENVVIGEHAVLHSFVTIYHGAHIGDRFFAHAHAVVREFCKIGNRVILQNGVIIGGDGLGYAKNADGSWYKMAQSGPAVLEDDVEVQANACIDRATARRALGAARRLTTWCWWATRRRWARIRCCADRWAGGVHARWRELHSGGAGRYRWSSNRWTCWRLPRKAVCRTMCRRGRSIRDTRRWRIASGYG